VRVVLRATAADDIDPASNTATVSPRVVRVGDSRVTRKGARRISGTARKGAGPLRAAALRPSRVHVAILRRSGGRCRWLTSASGRFTSRKAGRKGSCPSPRWVAAAGTARWRLRLGKALPRGAYVVFSRTTIGAGFREARFSAGDGNRVALRVRGA
jgi:hypothetical protein